MSPSPSFFSFIFILFWVSTISQTSSSSSSSPASSRCSNGGPEIHHPFHIKTPQKLKQPHHQYEVVPLPSSSSSSGFGLICNNNLTTIHFPSYDDHVDSELVVKSISYDTKRLDLSDPRNCLHHVFLNLDLSLTPFRFYYVLKNYTFLNCSNALPPPFLEVPCLSGSNYHVYTVEPSSSPSLATVSCVAVKTVAIPFEYSPYLSDNSLGLGFTWDWEELRSQETNARKSHTVRYTVVSIIGLCVFGIGSIIVKWSNMKFHQKEDQLLQSFPEF